MPRSIRESHRACAGPGRHLVVLGSKRNSPSKQAKKRRSKSSSKVPTVQMPRSRDDAVYQAALSLRAHYRNALAALPKRGISEELDVAEVSEVVTSYCICPTNTSELSLSQDIVAAMLGSATGTCVFVTESYPAEAGNIVTYADAVESDADYYVCVAPSVNEITKMEALLRQLKGSRRRTCPLFVVINPEWCADLGGAGWDQCSVKETAYCFFPILIKPLMMQTLEGVVYKTTAGSDDEKPWKVWAGNEQVGQMAARPSTGDVESILYNAIAAKNKKDGKGAGNPFSKLFGA